MVPAVNLCPRSACDVLAPQRPGQKSAPMSGFGARVSGRLQIDRRAKRFFVLPIDEELPSNRALGLAVEDVQVTGVDHELDDVAAAQLGIRAHLGDEWLTAD